MNISDLPHELFELINNCLPHQTLINKQFINREPFTYDISEYDHLDERYLLSNIMCKGKSPYNKSLPSKNNIKLLILLVNHNNFKLLEYYSNSKYNNELMIMINSALIAAFYKKFKLMKICLKHKYLWIPYAYIYVISFGNKKIIKWIQQKNYCFDHNIHLCATMFGKLNKLKYLISIYGSNIANIHESQLFSSACNYNRHNVIQWLIDNNYTFTYNDLHDAIDTCDIKCVKPFINHLLKNNVDMSNYYTGYYMGCECCAVHIDEYDTKNCLPILKYLYKTGFTCPQYIIDKYHLVR